MRLFMGFVMIHNLDLDLLIFRHFSVLLLLISHEPLDILMLFSCLFLESL